MLVIYLILLALLLILFVLLTAIVLTFKFTVLSLKEKHELGGTFTVKWLFFSHTFLIGESGEKTYPPDESGMEDRGKEIVEAETPKEKTGSEQAEDLSEDLAEYKDLNKDLKTKDDMQIEDRGSGEERPEEETVIPESRQEIELNEKTGVKKKSGIFDRIKRKKRADKEDQAGVKREMTTREKLNWGLEAYKSLRKPLFRLVSDLFNAIKIKYLKADLTFGLSDPADTGMLCGLIHALLGTFYSRCRSCSFSVSPVFMESLLDLRGSAEIRVKICSLIFPFIKFILNGKTLSFTYSIVKEKLRGSSKINS